MRTLTPFPGPLRHLGLLLALGSLGATSARAEMTMDSQDPLSVARSTALDRSRNGNLAAALAAARNAVTLAEKRLGPVHPSLVPYLMDQAALQRTLGQLDQAESSLRWAQALLERNGTDSAKLAPMLLALTGLYVDWGRWEDARYWGRRTLTLLERQDAGQPQALVQTLLFLAEVSQAQGNRDEALALLKRAQRTAEEGPSQDPALRILLQKELAQAYDRSQKAEQARACLDTILEMVKKSYPEGSVQEADALESLGLFDQAHGQGEKGQASLRNALVIYRKFVGSFYGYSALDYIRKLERAYLALGHHAEAEDLLQNGLPTARDAYGADHPRVAILLMDLARAQKGLGKMKESRTNAQAALKILQGNLPDAHPLVAMAKDLVRELSK